MRGAMDIFLFPSLYEGLPLTLVEAQASALPCIFSDVITEEVDIVKPFMHRVSLSTSAKHWADMLLSVSQNKSTITQKQSLNMIEESLFCIEKGVQELQKIYAQSNSSLLIKT